MLQAHPLALASPAFRELGLEREGLALVHPDVPLGHPLALGRSLLLHQDVEATAAQLGRDGAAWSRTVGAMGRRWASMADGVLEPLAIPPRAPVTTGLFGAAGLGPSTWFTRAVFRDYPARALFGGLAAHATLDLAAPLTSAVGRLFSAGWLTESAGPLPSEVLDSIADALVRRLESLGGEVRPGHRVTSMADVPAGRGAVLFDLTPRQILQIAGERFPQAYRRRLAEWRYGSGVFKVDWALDAPCSVGG